MLYGSAITHGQDRYVVVYTSEHRAEALKTIGRWAGDVTLNFNWFDAAAMGNEFRRDQDLERLLACGGLETIR